MSVLFLSSYSQKEGTEKWQWLFQVFFSFLFLYRNSPPLTTLPPEKFSLLSRHNPLDDFILSSIYWRFTAICFERLNQCSAIALWSRLQQFSPSFRAHVQSFAVWPPLHVQCLNGCAAEKWGEHVGNSHATTIPQYHNATVPQFHRMWANHMVPQYQYQYQYQ